MSLEPSTLPLSMVQLARMLRCDPSNITLMSDRPEKAGLVERRAHPTDGRVKVLAITTEGQKLYETVANRLKAISPLAVLSPHEQATLSEILAKVEPAVR